MICAVCKKEYDEEEGETCWRDRGEETDVCSGRCLDRHIARDHEGEDEDGS